MIAQGVELEKSGDKGGRPTKYKPEFCKEAYKLCLLGSTDKQLADFFEVAESTLNLWKLEYPEFSEHIKKGKTLADAEVAEGLFKRAKGYRCKATKFATYEGQITDQVDYIEHYPPDTAACFIWLKCRQPDRWKQNPDPYKDTDTPPPISISIQVEDARRD